MRKLGLKVTVAGAMAASLASCGGGGSSAPEWVTNAQPFTSLGAVPDSGSVAANGEARTATLIVDASTLDIALRNLSGRKDATAAALLEPGTLIALRASTDGATVTLDTRNGALDFSDFDVVDLSSPSGDRYIILVQPGAAGFEYQTFGSWEAPVSDTRGALAVGSFGAQTPALDVPIGGSASYSGFSTGYATDGVGNLYVTTSEITLATEDFLTIDLSSDATFSVNVLTFDGQEAPGLDFFGNDLVIVDGAFSGAVFGGLVTGSASGSLYGPSAEEAGGTFGLTGNGWTMLGSFGATEDIEPGGGAALRKDGRAPRGAPCLWRRPRPARKKGPARGPLSFADQARRLYRPVSACGLTRVRGRAHPPRRESGGT